MTRKQRHQGTNNITYDLSNPRNVAAFEALLEEEELEGHSRHQPRHKPAPKQKPKREKEKFWMLRDPQQQQQPDRGVDNALSANANALAQLNELFGGSVDPGLISDVFAACGSNFDATLEALLGMQAAGGGSTALPGAASSSRGTAGASSSSSSAAAAAASSSSSSAGMSWEALPEDVKQSILAHLPARDLAKAAHTNREFHQRSSSLRRAVTRLVLPPGLGFSALAGMVASHATASVVDLSRLERGSTDRRQQQDGRQQQPLPQVVAMQMQEAEANLFKSVLAVAEAAAAPSRQAPVTGLVLKGLAGATDRVLAEALQSLGGLRSLDLSHCPRLSNKSLYLVAKYQASEGLPEPAQDEAEEEAMREELQPPVAAEQDGGAAAAAGEWSESDTSDNSSSSSADEEEEAEADEGEGTAEAEQQQDEDTAADDEPWPEQEQLADLEPQDEQQAAAPPEPAGRAPAPHHPASAALTAAVAERMAALQLRSSQQAAASAAAVAAAVSRAAGLQALRLCGNKAFADDGLRQLLQGPVTKHSLATLDVSRCGFSQAGLVVPPLGVLRELRASHCQALTQLVIQLPASHPLASMDLSGCHFLRLVDLHLRSLQELNLSACRTLYRLRMRCPALKSLSLSQCGNLRDFHTDAWQVPALQQLNLFGCRRAAGSMLQLVLDQLPELRWLSVNGCWAIATLHLTANPQLQSADITGCRNLLAFSSSSAALRELQAASCSRMSSLTLASSQLQALTLTNCSQLSEVHTGTAAAPAGDSQGRARSSLRINGCSRLSPAAKARLAAVMAH